MHPFRMLSLLALPLLVASCTRRPSDPAIALEMKFDGQAKALTWVGARAVSTPTGIAFEPGVTGQAVRFDGSGASIDLAPVDALPLAGELTLELWVKVADWENPYTGSPRLETIVSHATDFTIEVLPDAWTFRAGLSTAEDKLTLAGGAARLGCWQHVALVVERDSCSALLYVDGQEVAQQPTRGDLKLTPGIPLRVGTWFQKNQAYCGSVDELRLWLRALPASEIRERASALGAPLATASVSVPSFKP
jgi:Concanavalin A-like lectin/glucanases superfamily